ncbi:radical SAM protein [Rossellomorea vietnamensis]|uniref:radical SAM protein n=1 Tax=Rossellomorea vietnamensis TaxID=218284 RepID=UPI003D2C6037
MNIKYLFIRILESCNAGCWFCGFAKSGDSYRLSLEEYQKIIEEAKKAGVEYVRFTGGETLLHNNLVDFVRIANENGLKTSLITNGFLLEKKIDELSKNGLNQVIVSLDEVDQKHNDIRLLPRLFERALKGLEKAKKLGVQTRVNTVCGPHNYKSMPELQSIFTEAGVNYWELSALKLDEKIIYEEGQDEVNDILEKVYVDGESEGRLVPFGKYWCGNTEEEQTNYFEHSLPPRATGKCHMVNLVRYYDAKNRNLYVCSLLPHRGLSKKYYRSFDSIEEFSLTDDKTQEVANYFYHNGPSICHGCSSTASGCSDMLSAGEKEFEFMY